MVGDPFWLVEIIVTKMTKMTKMILINVLLTTFFSLQLLGYHDHAANDHDHAANDHDNHDEHNNHDDQNVQVCGCLACFSLQLLGDHLPNCIR